MVPDHFEIPHHCAKLAFSVPHMTMGEKDVGCRSVPRTARTNAMPSLKGSKGLKGSKKVKKSMKKAWQIRLDPDYMKKKGKLVFYRD